MLMKLRHFFLFIILLGFNFPLANAQRVGVVLSGGGAKGIAHIGL